MPTGSRFRKISVAALAFSLVASPAFPDVKAGVDAWGRGDYEAAVKQWRDPALNGNADAQFNMGQAYKLGRGVKTDLNVALDWYKKAAAQDHVQAADSYGHLLHYQGRVPDSLPFLQASSDRGDPRAQYLLATELFNGVHIQKDWVRAYALMTCASSAGMGTASRSLSQMDQYIPLEQRQAATVLAGELEQRASRARATQVSGFPINTPPPLTNAHSDALPGFPSDIAVTSDRTTKPVPAPKPIIANSGRTKAPRSKPTPVKTDGSWRIQLGAFGKKANATKLWTSLEGRIVELASLQPYLKAAGNVTRLQAGPFPSKAAAEAVCGRVKTAGEACIAVRR